MKHSSANWLMLICLIGFYGTSFAFTAVALEGFSPTFIVFSRVALATVILTAAMLIKGYRLPSDGASWLVFIALALVGNVIPFFLIAWGQQSVSSGLAGLLMSMMPLFVMLLAHYFVTGEQLNRFKILGFILGIGGVYLIVSHSLGTESSRLFGGLAILMAAFCYACTTIIARVLVTHHILVNGAGMMISATLIMLPILLLSGVSGNSPTPQSTLALIWLGIGPTGLATILTFTVISSAGPTFSANINYLIPVVAYFLGAWLLHEPVDIYSLFALPMILAGIYITRIQPAGVTKS